MVRAVTPRKVQCAAIPSALACAVLALLSAVGIAQRCVAQSQEDEYRVKAAFLFHFGELADWPPAAFRSDRQTFNVCTLGDDPFLGELEDTVGGKLIGARIVKVQHLKQPQEALGCQILFFGPRTDKSLPAILSQLGNDPILTVGENDEFLQQGGIIYFFLEDNKIRFDINLNAADRAGLKIGARLLLLARNVIGTRKGG